MNTRPPTPFAIERCQPLAEKQVLALAAQAWPENERAGQWQSIRGALEAADSRRVVLLAARHEGGLVAAVLGHVLAGRSAAVWPPQFAPGVATPPPMASILLEQLAVELAASGASLVQALVAPGDRSSAELLQSGHFEHAAELLYLAAPADVFPNQPPELPFSMEPFSIGDEARLAALIEQTYLGTLDCPRLDKLRRVDDVIAGYRAVGQFRAELWQFAVSPDGDAGCLLVNLHPEHSHAEIVYLGIVPHARGRAYGRHLVRQAQWLARQHRCDRVVLAVDAANDPAISAYAATGFIECGRRALWVRAINNDVKY
jgi:mycothiol synthase